MNWQSWQNPLKATIRSLLLVFKGPVWSSFFSPILMDHNHNRLLIMARPKKKAQMGPNHLKQKFFYNLFKPTKTGILVVFYT